MKTKILIACLIIYVVSGNFHAMCLLGGTSPKYMKAWSAANNIILWGSVLYSVFTGISTWMQWLFTCINSGVSVLYYLFLAINHLLSLLPSFYVTSLVIFNSCLVGSLLFVTSILVVALSTALIPVMYFLMESFGNCVMTAVIPDAVITDVSAAIVFELLRILIAHALIPIIPINSAVLIRSVLNFFMQFSCYGW